MKKKNIFIVLSLALSMLIGLTACTSEDSMSEPKVVNMENGFYVQDVDFICEAPGYDQGTTRAVTYNWNNGATILARFKSGSSYYQGFLVLGSNGWVMYSTSEFNSQSRSGTCELYYFQQEDGDYYHFNSDTGCFDIYNNGSLVRHTEIAWNATPLDLSDQTAVYTTTTATYSTTETTFSIKATLTPYFWRMRFNGTNGATVTLPGVDNDIRYCYAFNWSTSEASFTEVTNHDVSLKVNGSYTPYVYGHFKNPTSNNKITVKSGNDIYTRTFNGNNLKSGTSGYFTIPTASNYSSNGWTKVATTQEMILKDFLEKPFGIVEGVNLKTDSYETIQNKLASLYTFTRDTESFMIYAKDNESLKNLVYDGASLYNLYIANDPDDVYSSYRFIYSKDNLSDPYPVMDKMVKDFKDMGITISYEKKSKTSTSNNVGSGYVRVDNISYHINVYDYETSWEYTISMFCDKGPSTIANCKFVPNKFLAYTDGCVTDWNVDTKVSKGYFQVYKKTDISSKTDAEIVADLIKTDEINASNLNNNVFYRGGDSYSANTNYVLCSVGFDSSGNQGELNRYEFKTRSSTLPMAALSDFKYNSNYWFYTITSKYSATSYYLYFNESTGVHDWSRWYFRYRIYFAIQNNELGMGTSDTVYSAWGDKQITRDESQFSICTWAIVSGKTLGNPDSYQGHIQSSAPSMISEIKQSAQPQSDRVSKQEGEALFKQGKLILVKCN